MLAHRTPMHEQVMLEKESKYYQQNRFLIKRFKTMIFSVLMRSLYKPRNLIFIIFIHFHFACCDTIRTPSDKRKKFWASDITFLITSRLPMSAFVTFFHRWLLCSLTEWRNFKMPPLVILATGGITVMQPNETTKLK